MRYRDVERRLEALERRYGELQAANPTTPDEECAAVLSEYSDLTPAEVARLDPPAFWAFLEWTGQTFMLTVEDDGDPEFDPWAQRMCGNPPADLLRRLIDRETFPQALIELAGGRLCGQALVSPFLARSERNHPARIRWLGPTVCRANGCRHAG